MNQPAFEQGSDSDWAKNSEGSESKGSLNSQEEIMQALKLFGAEEGPGKFLKKLRELAERNEASFAAELGISLHQLKAMEADDFANLPAPIYMKSYYQRYSAIIGVPDEEFLRVYDAMRQSESPQLNRVSIRDKVDGATLSFTWMKYIGGIAVAALVVFLIQSIDFSGIMDKSTNATDASEEATELSIPQRKLDESAPLEP